MSAGMDYIQSVLVLIVLYCSADGFVETWKETSGKPVNGLKLTRVSA